MTIGLLASLLVFLFATVLGVAGERAVFAIMIIMTSEKNS